MTLRERLESMFRMALILFILASVTFLSALTAMRFAIQGREVTMPDVGGMTVAAAHQALQGRGLGMKVEDRIYSTLPVDVVVRQSPPPKMRVKIGQYTHVVLSLGPQTVKIPQLVGMSVRAAQIELLRGSMQVGEVSGAHLPEWEEGVVIQQDPASATTDVTSPHVNLLVSLGKPPAVYVMPDLTGLALGEAESKLNGGSLKASRITFSPVPGSAHGAVVNQAPIRGQRVDSTTVIELQAAQ
jgi:eukaryotic-like serine/threonine-protein kinase